MKHEPREMSMEEFIVESWNDGAAPAPEPGPAADLEQPEDSLDVTQARLDSEKLASLMADTRAALEDYRSPAAVLSAMIRAMFGDGSQEAEDAAALIRESEQPGGYEIAIATIDHQKRLLKKQAKELEKELTELNDRIDTLDEITDRLKKDHGKDSDHTKAMIETMQLCQSIKLIDNPLDDIKRLYDKYHDDAAAMGLLLGTLTTAARGEYDQEEYDMIRQEDFRKLMDQLQAAAAGIS